MFEITPDDVALLNDAQLREVVARLCEAELRQRGLSPAYVTWGGNQNAADGGIDIRVALPVGMDIEGFIPRAATGFQVKQQDMPPAEVRDEMRPEPAKTLRPSIQALADQAGAYIIVSSQGSTADAPLAKRREAMSAAVQGEPNANDLVLDFYDRTRIATWVRAHAGLIPWVRQLVGRSVPGWQPFGPWAYRSEPLSAEYLVDDTLRIHSTKGNTENGVSALEGIGQLRDELQIPRSVVRLVGLSGVGKTRLVHALFDERIGSKCLDPATAIYTNMADSPNPQPIELASNLVAGGTRAILVIDNCTPDLHQRLSEVCRQPNSHVSVITIEYDVREDQPEGTEVFKLDTSSPELIEKLLALRFPALSQVDARTISKSSGGNASIAIALAGTVDRNESVAGLTDEQLFQRLFLQRHTHDQSLYLAARACSLVYSFEGEDVSNDPDAELFRLSALVGMTQGDLYRHVAELRARDLVQQRGVWRAVLPHAIANRLAATALKTIPYASLDEQLLRSPSGRLRKSFARRLGYLHASKEAVKIAKQGLGSDGPLENVPQFTELDRSVFESIAPVAPEAVVAALERACAQDPSVCSEHVDLIRRLAYEPEHFGPCMALLTKTIEAEQNSARSHSRDVFASLFHLHLSGTQATIEQRLAVIATLLVEGDETRPALGVLGLRAVLETWHFYSVSDFEFGARRRDFGYWPRTGDEERHWFASALAFAERFACGGTPVAAQVRAVLAEQFYGVWNRGGVHDELVALCQKLHEASSWAEGWLAVRRTLDLDGKGMSAARLAQLVELECALRPSDLPQKVRAIVLSRRHLGIDLGDFEDHTSEDTGTRMERSEKLAKELGIAVAEDAAVLDELLPELVSSAGRLWSFGEGLYAGAADVVQVWQRLVAAFAATDEGKREPLVLCGYLRGVHAEDPVLAATFLEQAVEHDILAPWFPRLQVTVPIDDAGVDRLRRSLAQGKTPMRIFTYLMYGRATAPIPPADLRDLILTIAGMPDGYDVALEIFSMRLHAEKETELPLAAELATTGCELLRRLRFSRNDREDYRIGEIAQYCLVGDDAPAVVREVCAKFIAAVRRFETSAWNHDDLLTGLFRAQPLAACEALFGETDEELERGVDILRNLGSRKHPLAVVSDQTLLDWCDLRAETRYVAIASVLPIFGPTTNGVPSWSSIALQFLARAPEPAAVLSCFTSQFMPASGWSGSLAAILDANSQLLNQLEQLPELQPSISQEKLRVRQWIEDTRAREAAHDRQCDERFE
jgi:hypothetical protein